MIRSLCCFAIATLPFAATSASADEPSNRTITVTGTATVHYLPDAAKIQFRVRSSEANLDEVRQANQKALKLVDEKLSALKIKDMKIAFAPVNAVSTPSSSRFRGGGDEIGGGFNPKGGGPGGVANRNISSARLATVTVRDSDVEKLAEAIGKIEKTLIDANIVSGSSSPFDELPSSLNVTLFRRDDTEFRDQALTKAVQSAIQKAKAIAKGAGVEIKETVSIVENTDVTPTTESPARTASRLASTLASGELEITVRVTVKCSY